MPNVLQPSAPSRFFFARLSRRASFVGSEPGACGSRAPLQHFALAVIVVAFVANHGKLAVVPRCNSDVLCPRFTLPSLGVVVLSLGVLLEDALIALAGVVLGAAGIALEIYLATTVIDAAKHLI